MAFSNAQLSALADAANRMLVAQARELPVDGTAVAPELASVAVSTGFATSTGQFLEAIREKPVSTLVLFIAFAGGSGKVLPAQ
jgi:hypothetical protein